MKAIDVLKNEKECVLRNISGCDRNCSDCDLALQDKDIISAYDNAISALEKQIPKKPTIITKGDLIGGYCPSCGARKSYVDLSWHKVFNKYCHNCGQALDWSEERKSEPKDVYDEAPLCGIEEIRADEKHYSE